MVLMLRVLLTVETSPSHLSPAIFMLCLPLKNGENSISKALRSASFLMCQLRLEFLLLSDSVISGLR